MTCVSGLHPLTHSRHLGSTLTWKAGQDGRTECPCYCEKMKRASREKGPGEKEICQGNDGRGYQCPRGTDRLPSVKKLWSTEL